MKKIVNALLITFSVVSLSAPSWAMGHRHHHGSSSTTTTTSGALSQDVNTTTTTAGADTFPSAPVPEPLTLTLMGTGLAGMILRRKMQPKA